MKLTATATGLLISLTRRTLRHFANTSLAIIAILYTFGALLVQVGVWAIVLYGIGAVQSSEASVYVSLMSFTTLGISDADIAEEWRLLAGMIGVDGFLLFGWSTAFMVELLRRTS